MTIAETTVRLTGIPEYQAAWRLRPTVSMRKPLVVRPSTHQIKTPRNTAKKNPDGKLPKKGSLASSEISEVRVKN